jgi:hypothetical protein
MSRAVAGSILELARIELNDTNPNKGQRWSDARLLKLLDMESKDLMRDLRWPPAKMSTVTVPNLQYYQVEDVIEDYFVFVNGQMCVETEFETIMGTQTNRYDQGQFPGSGGTQTPGSFGPSGNSGFYTPQWTITPPSGFPVNNSWFGFAPDAQPWRTNMRPRYAFYGGFLVIFPAPANGPEVIDGTPVNNIDIWCATTPDTVTSLDQQLWYPEFCESTLMWGVVKLARYSDKDTNQALRLEAADNKREKLAGLRMWKSSYTGQAGRGPKLQTQRGIWRQSRNRNRGGGYPG